MFQCYDIQTLCDTDSFNPDTAASQTVPLGENAALDLYGSTAGNTAGQNTNIGAELRVFQPGGGLNAGVGADYSNQLGMSTSARVGVTLPINDKLAANGEVGVRNSNLFGTTHHTAAGILYRPDNNFSVGATARRDYVPGFRPNDSFGVQMRWQF